MIGARGLVSRVLNSKKLDCEEEAARRDDCENAILRGERGESGAARWETSDTGNRTEPGERDEKLDEKWTRSYGSEGKLAARRRARLA